MLDRLVWIDLEMTGLNPETAVIVEIATLITDGHLNLVAEGPELVIHQPDAVLGSMDDVVTAMHTRSGLLDRIRQSDVTLEQAEEQTRRFVLQHCSAKTSPLCGNSIHKDRQFLEVYMPALNEVLHYRHVDVSTLKELIKRWYPERLKPPVKAESHRALDDIRESIKELQYYREHFFVAATPSVSDH